MTGSDIIVTAGDQYLIRAKGFRNGTTPVSFIIRVNGSIDMGSSTSLPYRSMAEGWIEKVITIPSGGTTLSVAVGWNPTATGESFLLNEFEISKLSTTTPEYQYNLKDHLGNVRVTFTSTPETVSDVATMEAANASTEKSKFLRYDNARTVNYYLFDHTNGSSPSTTTGKAQRLNGQGNEIYGLGKSLSVMPGDVINMEVYAKYIDSNSANRTGSLNTLITQIASGTAAAGTVVDGSTYTSSTTSFPFAGGLNGTSTSSGSGPKAYLNWLVFDKNYTLITSKSGYTRMTTAAKETGQDVAHEYLSGTVTISDPGYVYVYLSNEEGANPYEVYFDDMKVTQVKSAVIQSQNYYPFGLTFNNYQRENSIKQNYLTTDKELQDELDLDLFDFDSRMYMPETGRWSAIDPLGDKYNSVSPYNYTLNNPVLFVDPNGEDVYLFYYTTNNKDHDGNEDEDADKAFLMAAITRALDVVKSSEYSDKDDHIVLKGISDMGSLGKNIQEDINTWGGDKGFGQTKEFGIWSHAAFDGPVGTAPASQDAIHEGGTQISDAGWGKINFNWASDAKAGFYGCRTGADQLDDDDNKIRDSFAQRISSNSNMKDVSAMGQTKRTWPSPYTDVRYSTDAIQEGKHNVPTYFVGSRKDPIVRFTSGVLGMPTYGYPMAVYKNGQFMGLRSQPGRKYMK